MKCAFTDQLNIQQSLNIYIYINISYPLSDEEKALRRSKMAAAADERASTFKGGGGGEALKAKAKKLDQAERKNQETNFNNPGVGGLNDPRAWD